MYLPIIKVVLTEQEVIIYGKKTIKPTHLTKEGNNYALKI